jgi:hypothetical protein
VWFAGTDPVRVSAAVDRLRELVGARLAGGQGDGFDRLGADTLDERAGQLARLSGLRSELPRLGWQVLHGDYTLANLLFGGERLSAVLDFRPPEPFLVAYELGRIAFNPDSIATDRGWLGGARAVLRGYLTRCPPGRCPGLRPGRAGAVAAEPVRGQAALPGAWPVPGRPGPILVASLAGRDGAAGAAAGDRCAAVRPLRDSWTVPGRGS